MQTLSIIIPAYNERATIAECLARVSTALPAVPKDIVVVDDGSRDGTREWLLANADGLETGAGSLAVTAAGGLEVLSAEGSGGLSVRVLCHDRNRGKGGALRSGFAAARGDVIVVQDADLEYDPRDWAVMYDLIVHRRVADVVYGSRFHGNPHRALYFHHYMANRLISFLFNALYDQTLSDIEVCYKMFTREVLDSLRLSADDFGIEVELSARFARARRWRIYETGISYYGRTYDEGKKINWRDGLKALWYVVKYRFTA